MINYRGKGVSAVKTGLLVKEVTPRSTAKELGLESGDVITAINGVNVKNRPELVEQLNKFRPGETITLTYYRDNKKHTATGKLRNTQGNTEITKIGDFSELGCAFKKLTAEEKKKYEVYNGVMVTGMQKGLIREAGVREGFIIQSINDRPVNSSDDVEDIYNRIMKDDNADKVMILTGIYPDNGRKRYYAVDLAGN